MAFSEFREEEREGWSRRAEGYADATARATLQSIPALLAAAQIFPGARVADVGCGPGYAAGAVAALGGIPTGIDFSAAMVSAARVRFPGIAFLEGDAEALPLQDESQDSVVSNIVLFHVTDPRRAVAEALRVLRPGGHFAFSQWCAPQESACYQLLFEVLSDCADLSLASPAPNAFDLSDRDAARGLLRSAGFSGIATAEVPNLLRADSESFYDFFMDFGVRIPAIMRKQPPDVRRKVKAEIDARAERYRVGGEIRIPMPSIVVSGRR